MLVLRCTRRVLDLFGERPRQVQVSGSEEGLGEWYVHIVDDLEEPLFLCVNARSLYTLLVDVDEPGFRSVHDLASAMVSRLLEHLVRLGLGGTVSSKVAGEYEYVMIGKTASRRVLGSMNDLVNNLQFLAGRQMAERGNLDLWALEDLLNSIPQLPMGGCYARDRLVELCSRT